MTIAILADDSAFEEITKKAFADNVEWVRTDTLKSLTMIEADAYFDLGFEPIKERIASLRIVLPRPVFIGSVNNTLNEIGEQGFIRINNWSGMIERDLVELVVGNNASEKQVMDALGWKYVKVQDIPGMITPRIIAAIINEAFFTLSEGVSNEEEIDKAMKLGTNYPYGPFEWAERIGHKQILSLLKSLYPFKSGYDMAPSLLKKINDQ